MNEKIKAPNSETIRISAIANLRELGNHEEGDLLSRCKMEIASAQRYAGSSVVGLNITLRCRASDLSKFRDEDSVWDIPSHSHYTIQKAVESVLPVEFKVHDMSARSFLVDRNEFDKTELEKLIEAQKDLMTAVSTGGPRIQTKNEE
jgi:hypothetical protein